MYIKIYFASDCWFIHKSNNNNDEKKKKTTYKPFSHNENEKINIVHCTKSKIQILTEAQWWRLMVMVGGFIRIASTKKFHKRNKVHLIKYRYIPGWFRIQSLGIFKPATGFAHNAFLVFVDYIFPKHVSLSDNICINFLFSGFINLVFIQWSFHHLQLPNPLIIIMNNKNFFWICSSVSFIQDTLLRSIRATKIQQSGGIQPPLKPHKWSYASAFLYSITLITTIGK